MVLEFESALKITTFSSTATVMFAGLEPVLSRV